MTSEQVLMHWRTRPFKPFRIVTVVGECIDVWHPNLMLVAGEMITVGRPHPTEPPPSALDGTWLAFEDVARVEPLEAVVQH
jgi:hypothetical protein